jgi:hypothetical protein
MGPRLERPRHREGVLIGPLARLGTGAATLPAGLLAFARQGGGCLMQIGRIPGRAVHKVLVRADPR